MSTFYVANQNGDWWAFDNKTGAGAQLFVISEADLKKAIADEDPEGGEVYLGTQDKLEQVIIEHGEMKILKF